MSIAALVVKLNWFLLVGMLLMAWFIGMLMMAMAVALGAALLEVYWEWARRRKEKRDAKRRAKEISGWGA